MSSSREIVKKVLFNKTEGFNNSIMWEESLNSWVIVNNQTAKRVLNSSDFTANRKKQFIDKLDASYEQKLILKDYYSNWLMYMEGDDHKSLRKKIPEISEKATNEILSDINKEEFNAISDVVKPYSNLVLSKIFGLSIIDYQNILKVSTEAVNFLWYPNPTETDIDQTVESILKTTNYINKIIDDKSYNEDGLFSLMLQNISVESEFIIALVNMVIDGHEPFQSSLSNLIFYYIHIKEKVGSEMTDKDLVNESIRIEPPFSYCARECVNDTYIEGNQINNGDRLMVVLYVSNNIEEFENNSKTENCEYSKKNNLSFGHGMHYCLGAQITLLSLEKFIEIFKQIDDQYKWQINDYSSETSYGFKSITDLNIVTEEMYVK
ncbi:cytochrome P450 [Staphylococcus xylosus]|uniref:cytochrome P450 n=1 Tax=Staphylococcus xylosus TaxID=1288 RepID=UPI001E38EF22|nr:cytochrome P450 [Staphylococcus xylosus]MCD8851391.1 cytochrome P450 [Staphylococcus xylosus]